MESINMLQQNQKKSWCSRIALCVVLMSSCSAFASVNSKASLSSLEQKQLTKAVNRASNNQIYPSNLEKVAHPRVFTLYKEAKLKRSNVLNKNYQVLEKWYENKLSKQNKTIIEQNCANMLRGFKSQFPLTEKTISCAGWWLDERISEREQAKSQYVVKHRRKYFRLKVKDRSNWYKYRNLSLLSAIRNMELNQFNDIEKLAKTALKSKIPCRYLNANFALITTLEDFLPKKEAYKYITKLYDKSSKCYVPNGILTERISLRMGVLHIAHGNHQKAKQALYRTQFEKNPRDSSRSLFWLGAIENQRNKKQINNKYWNKLIREKPFSFFSIIANLTLKRDPKDKFVSDKIITLQNRVSGGWNETNLQAFLFDLFYSKNHKVALKALSSVVAKSQVQNKNLYLYWAISHNAAENSRSSIASLTSYLSIQKQPRISNSLVKLYFPMRFSKEILNRSNKVDPLLVLSLIRQESAFDPSARSHANARGLMQMLPSTAKTLNRRVPTKKLYDPQTNINLGITYLENLFERYEGRTEYVLAAYNAGFNRVDAWSARIDVSPIIFMEYVPYRETRNYVSVIMRNYYWYKRLMGEEGSGKDAQKFLNRNMSSIWTPKRIMTVMK